MSAAQRFLKANVNELQGREVGALPAGPQLGGAELAFLCSVPSAPHIPPTQSPGKSQVTRGGGGVVFGRVRCLLL